MEDELTAQHRAAGEAARAHHRVYLGMAPGVGKTYAALQELHRRRASGASALVGYVETYDRPGTIEALGDLEVVPRRKIPYKGLVLDEMDVDAVRLRHPDVVLVDEIAHTNAPGSRHEKRWQDAQELLDSGISVLSTVNIQHLESLADVVAGITGIEVRERIPDRVIDEADEIELVDLSPGALRQRIQQGDVYPKERAEQALRRYFREGNLTALRELSLREVATEVERDLETYMREHGVRAVSTAAERVMVGVTDQHTTQALLRRGWRMANRYNSELLAVFVQTPDWASAPAERRRELEMNLQFARDLGATVLRVEDTDVAHGLVRAAREHNVGHLLVGHARAGRLQEFFGMSIAQRLLHLTNDIDIHVVASHTNG